MAAGDRQSPETLAGWIPAEIDVDAGPPSVTWMKCSGLDWSLPFFDSAVEAFRALGPTESITMGIDALLSARDLPTLPPNGLFFHTARCGSTVLANMWLALPDPIIVKSAQPIDAVLRADLAIESGQRSALLAGVLAALGQPLRGTEQSCWHKLTSWNLLEAERIRALHPQVPVFFMYRNPLECLVGWLRRPPRMWQFDPVPGLRRSEMSDPEYFARLLAIYLDRGLSLVRDGGAELGNYSELRGPLVARFFGHFGVPFTDAIRAHAERELSVNAKRRGQTWVPDAEERRRDATDEERQAVDRWCLEPYELLEAIRHQRWG